MLHMAFIVSSIVDTLQKKGKKAGRIQIQKFVYFLKNMGIKVSYSFEMSSYGPYSADLSKKIAELEFEDILEKKEEKGFDYIVAAQVDLKSQIVKKQNLYKNVTNKIEILLNTLPELEFNTLELYSTVHYSYKTLKLMEKEEEIQEQDLISEVKRWKGEKFSAERILTAFKRIQNKSLLQ